MTTVTLEFSDAVFSAIPHSPAEFAQELRLAAAMFWFARGQVSQEQAAQIAGMEQARFRGLLAEQQASEQWMRLAETSGSLDFWDAPEEDIYTASDGERL